MSEHFTHIQSLLGNEPSILAFLQSNNLVVGEADDYAHYQIVPFLKTPSNSYKFQIENSDEWFIKTIFPSISKSEIKQLMSINDFVRKLFPAKLKRKASTEKNDECKIINYNGCISFSSSAFGFMLKGPKAQLSFSELQIKPIELSSNHFDDMYNQLLENIDACFEYIKDEGYSVNTQTVLTMFDDEIHDTLPSRNMFIKNHRDSELYELLSANKDGVSFSRDYGDHANTDIDSIFDEHNNNSHQFLVSDFKLMKKVIDLCFHAEHAQKVYQLVSMTFFVNALLRNESEIGFTIWHPKQNNIKHSDVIRHKRSFTISKGIYFLEFYESVNYINMLSNYTVKSFINHNSIDDCYAAIVNETKNALIEKLSLPDESFCNEHISVLKMMDF